jgi:hypothetical protein
MKLVQCFLGLATLFCALPAAAVDTVEVWAPGATDIDFYTGFGGFGLPRSERELSSELMAGFGLIDRLSAYLGANMATDERFAQGGGEVFLGLFGTPVQINHFDVDLFLDFRLGGEGFTEVQVTPAAEFNFDLAPNLELWGMYLMVALPMYQRATGQDGEITGGLGTHVETTVGTYLTLAKRHQLLVDYEMAWRPRPGAEEQTIEIGSLGLGYNVLLTPALELITEVRIDIPQGADEAVSAGVMVGLIATMPPADA